MTRNQIEALKLQEEKRKNRVHEAVDIASIPAAYLSAAGTVARGISGFFKGVKNTEARGVLDRPKRYNRTHYTGGNR